jgi:cyanophycinase
VAGYLLLAGGSEFEGMMFQPDLRAIELAGGSDAPICILPTAAGRGHRYENAGTEGVQWFRDLGARQVEYLPVMNKKTANDAQLAERLSHARLIYLMSGYMGHLGRTLANSACWKAMLSAYSNGAVIAGSAAGAMVLCQQFYDPSMRKMYPGLGLLPNTCILPHHDVFGKGWVERLRKTLPGVTVLGIDEQTAMINDMEHGSERGCNVYGQGAVTLYHEETEIMYRAGQLVPSVHRE